MRSRSKSLLVVTVAVAACVMISGWSSGWFKPTETTITEIAPGVFFRKTETQPKFIGCNAGWVEFKEFVLVIEANFPNQADALIAEIRKRTDKPIRYVFDTHYHGDHADGNQRFTAQGATAVAAENSKALFETNGLQGFKGAQKSNPDEYGQLEYAIPSLYFPKKLVIDDGTQRVELIHLGHAHTAGDAMAWLPEHGILFTGDACVNGAFNNLADSDVESWIKILEELEKLPVKIVCPGHGEQSDKSLLATQRKYFIELRDAVRALIADGKTLEQIKKELDLPSYKEWTGVDARTQVPNIENMYKQLTKADK